jgi:hypothetical protein
MVAPPARARRTDAIDRAARAAAAAEERAWIARMERRLHTERACRKITAGWGWLILERPEVPHEKLEFRVRRTWSEATYGRDWPTGWRARWGRFSALLNGGADLLGGCLQPPWKLLLFAEGHRCHRTEEDLTRTVVHELAHLATPDDKGAHGRAFVATLREFEQNVFGRTPDASDPWSRYARELRRDTTLANLAPTSEGAVIGYCENCRRWRIVPIETASPIRCPICPVDTPSLTLPERRA